MQNLKSDERFFFLLLCCLDEIVRKAVEAIIAGQECSINSF